MSTFNRVAETLADLLQRHPLIFFHLVTAFAALVLGGVVLARRKGTTSHKALGWTWVVLITSTALSSVFIHDYVMPNLAGFTPIHLFTVITAVTLPRGIMHIRQGRVSAHRKTMRGLYLGACVLAGVFTLLPGRFLGQLLWKQTLDLG